MLVSLLLAIPRVQGDLLLSVDGVETRGRSPAQVSHRHTHRHTHTHTPPEIFFLIPNYTDSLTHVLHRFWHFLKGLYTRVWRLRLPDREFREIM
jgi:hypothetical protein